MLPASPTTSKSADALERAPQSLADQLVVVNEQHRRGHGHLLASVDASGRPARRGGGHRRGDLSVAQGDLDDRTPAVPRG